MQPKRGEKEDEERKTDDPPRHQPCRLHKQSFEHGHERPVTDCLAEQHEKSRQKGIGYDQDRCEYV
jgi:hypothetical protein